MNFSNLYLYQTQIRKKKQLNELIIKKNIFVFHVLLRILNFGRNLIFTQFQFFFLNAILGNNIQNN